LLGGLGEELHAQNSPYRSTTRPGKQVRFPVDHPVRVASGNTLRRTHRLRNPLRKKSASRDVFVVSQRRAILTCRNRGLSRNQPRRRERGPPAPAASWARARDHAVNPRWPARQRSTPRRLSGYVSAGSGVFAMDGELYPEAGYAHTHPVRYELLLQPRPAEP